MGLIEEWVLSIASQWLHKLQYDFVSPFFCDGMQRYVVPAPFLHLVKLLNTESFIY